ncbi:MAG: adenine phosphoribosyltransferase [Candidatus Nanopelagicaceae bacterium]|nr:adenine phosphoribosyltransferase [Candidatus Nanopelagicaceae bacterium]
MNESLDLARSLIREIPDFPLPGILFQDLTPLLGHGPSLQAVVSEFAPWAEQSDAVAGLEARGFIFAGALAHSLGIGFIPIRKKGRLPFLTHEESYGLEYGNAIVEIHQDAITPGAKVLIIDDVLATGGTALAGIRLVERVGGIVTGVGTVLEIGSLGGRVRIHETYPSIPVHSIFTL